MHFSSRFHWDSKPNRLAQVLARKHAEGAPVIDLTQSNPTQAGFQYPLDVVRAFDDSAMLRYEPSPRGLFSAREAVSAYYAVRGHDVSPDRILLTASTSEAYSYIFKLLTDPGDTVLVPRPSYPLFEYLAAMESLEGPAISAALRSRLVHSHRRNTAGREVACAGQSQQPNRFFRQARRTRTPQSPGHPDRLRRSLLRLPIRARPGPHPTLVDFDDCLSFSMSGLSKVAGLPQMKLGWIVVNGPADVRCDAMDKLEWIADTYLSVVARAMRRAELLALADRFQGLIGDRTASNLRFARKLLTGTAASILDVEGGWYATIRMPHVRTEEEYALNLLEYAGVLVQPGYFYDFESEAYLIVSLLTEEAPFREGMARIRNLGSLR